MSNFENLKSSRKSDLTEARLNNLDKPNERMEGRHLTNHAMIHISTDLKEVGAVPMLDFMGANTKELKSISIEAYKTALIMNQEEGTDNPNLVSFHERALFVSLIYSLLGSLKNKNINSEEVVISLHQKIDKWTQKIKEAGYNSDLILNKSNLKGLYEEHMRAENYGKEENQPSFKVHEYLKRTSESEDEVFTYDEFLDFVLELTKLID